MAQPIILSYTITDALAVQATSVIYLDAPGTVTLANLQTFANDYTPLLDAITDGQIVGIEVRVPLIIAGAKSGPAEGAEVERTGLFNFEQAGTRYKNGVDVPAIKDELIVGGRINLTDAAVTSWRDFLLATTVGITVVSKFFNALVSLLDSLITFRKHRKLENKRSFDIP